MKRPSSTFQHFIDVKNHRSHCPDNPAGCSLCNKYLELRGWRERPQGFVMCPPWLQRESLWAHWNPSLAKTAIPALNYIVLRDQGSLLGSLLPHRKKFGLTCDQLGGRSLSQRPAILKNQRRRPRRCQNFSVVVPQEIWKKQLPEIYFSEIVSSGIIWFTMSIKVYSN